MGMQWTLGGLALFAFAAQSALASEMEEVGELCSHVTEDSDQHLLALCAEIQEEGTPAEKRKNEFVRFGKRKNEFIRFGKRSEQPAEEGAGVAEKRKNEFVRFGKRKNEFVRFGKRKNEFVRFGKRDEEVAENSGSSKLGNVAEVKKSKEVAGTMTTKRKPEFTSKNEFVRFGRSN